MLLRKVSSFLFIAIATSHFYGCSDSAVISFGPKDGPELALEVTLLSVRPFGGTCDNISLSSP